MLELIMYMLGLVVIWHGWIFVYWSYGYTLLKLFGLKNLANNWLNHVFAFFGGALFLIGLLQILQLVLPVNLLQVPLIVLGAFLGCLWLKGLWTTLIRFLKNNKVLIALYLLAIFVLANTALEQTTYYDTGLYHLPLSVWLRDFALLPGLANVHTRFGFNPSSVLLSALTDVPKLMVPGWVVFAGIFHTVLIGSGLISLRNLITKTWQEIDIWQTVYWSLGLGLLPLLCASIPAYFNGYGPDLIVIYLCIFLGSLALSYFKYAKQLPVTETHNPYYWLLIFAVLVGITIKLSFIFFGVVICLSCFSQLLMRHRRNKQHIKFIAAHVFLVISIFGVWCFRGIIISGYPLYPLPYLGGNTEWAVPAQDAAVELEVIKSWARLPGKSYLEVNKDYAWLAPWVTDVIQDRALILATASLIAFIFSLIVCRPKLKKGDTLQIVTFIAAVAVGLIGWFITAPDVRFAYGTLIFSTLILLAATILLVSKNQMQRVLKYLSGALVLMTLILFTQISLTTPTDLVKHQLQNWTPVIEYNQKITHQGLPVYWPTKDDMCWAGPIPCSPMYTEVRLRNGLDFKDGFLPRAE